ncbi:MAG: hypothetical protein ACKV2Q_04295 [Planctomycetaceae bacterium]
MIDALIDKLTNSIEEVATGRTLVTDVQRATRSDLKSLGPEWQFDWAKELGHAEVFKLVVPEVGKEIHGLISLSREADHVFVHLVENHPRNVGRRKQFAGVAGNLFAYAAKISFDLGHDGFVSFVAKTELIDHYRRTLGATCIGRGPKMYIDSRAAKKLIESYFGE